MVHPSLRQCSIARNTSSSFIANSSQDQSRWPPLLFVEPSMSCCWVDGSRQKLPTGSTCLSLQASPGVVHSDPEF